MISAIYILYIFNFSGKVENVTIQKNVDSFPSYTSVTMDSLFENIDDHNI